MALTGYLKALRQRIGHDYVLLPGVSALAFNERNEVLLGRRSDNGRWAIVGGMIDPGESPAHAALRELEEETGVRATVERVSGVYMSPVIRYPNQDVAQYATIAFRCLAVSGEPRVNDDESLEVRFFPLDGLPADLTPEQLQCIGDAAEPGALRPAVFDSRGD
jgi:8-oxo-dGTP pyrophosphatase MutT (NUDIX family)